VETNSRYTWRYVEESLSLLNFVIT